MRNFLYITFLFISCSIIAGNSSAQPRGRAVVTGKISNGDTLLFYDLPEIMIMETRSFKTTLQKKRYDRLVHNVKKVYPYAKTAMVLLDNYNKQIALLEKNKEKKRYVNNAEKELVSKYRKEIEDLTFTQGKILIKLIDRQTGHSSFEIIKDVRGSFPAYFWQTIAVLFGSNLKAKYDRTGEDQMIEDIVVLIECGQI